MPLSFNPAVKFAAVDAEADGDNEIIAAVAGKKIRVINYALTVDTTEGTITIQDTAGTPVVLGKLHLGIGESADFVGSPGSPAFETAAGEGVEINNPAGVDTYGHMAYIEV